MHTVTPILSDQCDTLYAAVWNDTVGNGIIASYIPGIYPVHVASLHRNGAVTTFTQQFPNLNTYLRHIKSLYPLENSTHLISKICTRADECDVLQHKMQKDFEILHQNMTLFLHLKENLENAILENYTDNLLSDSANMYYLHDADIILHEVDFLLERLKHDNGALAYLFDASPQADGSIVFPIRLFGPHPTNRSILGFTPYSAFLFTARGLEIIYHAKHMTLDESRQFLQSTLHDYEYPEMLNHFVDFLDMNDTTHPNDLIRFKQKLDTYAHELILLENSRIQQSTVR